MFFANIATAKTNKVIIEIINFVRVSIFTVIKYRNDGITSIIDKLMFAQIDDG
jgi:hypothetical protein